MDYYQVIAENFQSTIETLSLSVDELAPAIELASQVMTTALLQDNKILTCGNGVDAALGQLFCSNLLNRFEQERPALPALSLATDGPTLTAIAGANGIEEVFSHQLRALGQPSDILLCISSSGGSDNLRRAVQAAHERDMTVVALTRSDDPELSALLRPEDVELRTYAPGQARAVEVHCMTINCLCQLIDYNLFGTYTGG